MMTWIDLLYGALTVIVVLIGVWSRHQDRRLDHLEEFQKAVFLHWENDAKDYVSKADFNNLVKELKESLLRIENKIEKLRDGQS